MEEIKKCECETESRYVGTAIPLGLHKRLRQVAANDELSLSGLLREALVERLAKSERKRKQKDDKI